ncbi:MAG TPA: molybdate ABC transporter substrate-binding protein [Terracidiphilus sp.]|nr:molybdate ABC transporter substrate-binding protein [Terracidiphilus sp.]
MLKWITFLTLGLVMGPAASAQTTLRVAAAADLEPVLPGILQGFQNSTGIHVDATYKASAMLTAQIQNGAPFDLFLSADMGYPKRLVSAGLAEPGSFTKYATGTLVLWTRKDTHLPPPSITFLSDPALKRLAIADPERAPYGRAAVATLKSVHLYDKLKPRIVTAENIAQAAQFVESGNAQAGLISLTSALTPRLASSGTYFLIPHPLYPPIEQGIVVLLRTKQQAAAHQLLNYLLSTTAQAQFAKGGLAPARPVSSAGGF